MTLAMVVPSNLKSKAETDGSSRMMQEHQAKEKLSSSLAASTIYYSSDGENPANDHDEDEGDGKRDLIAKPGEHDVLLGRGGGTNNHNGNINFRKLVNQHKMRYLSCSKVEKPRVAREVVKIWRKQEPPGRFLQKKDGGASSTNGDTCNSRDDSLTATWVEVSEKKAQEKASQCLRERTSDVLPYLSQLQLHRDQMREHGVNMISQHFAAGADPSMPPLGAAGKVGNRFSPSRHGIENGMPNHNMVMSPSDVMSNNLRRGSMPIGCSPGTPVMPNAITQSMSPAARRTSMPAMGNHLPGHHQRLSKKHPNMDILQQNQFSMENQVLHEAYSAIEQSGGVDPRSMMLMEQMMQEQEMMERHTMMRERHVAMMQEQEQQRYMQSSGMSAGMPSGMSRGMSPRMNMGGSFMQNMSGMNDVNTMPGMHGMGSMAGGGGAMGGDIAQGYPSSMVPSSMAPSAMVHQQQEMMMQAHQQRLYHENMKETLIDQHRTDVLQRQAEEMYFKQQAAMRHRSVDPMATTPINVGSDGHFSQGDDVMQLQRQTRVHRRTPPPVINLTNMDVIPLMNDHGSYDEPIPLCMLPDATKSSPKSGQKDRRKRGNTSSVKASVETTTAFASSTPMSSHNGTDPRASSSKNAPIASPSTPTKRGAREEDDHLLDALSPIHVHHKGYIQHHDEVSRDYDEDEITAPLKGPSHPSPTRKLKSAIKGSFPPRGLAASAHPLAGAAAGDVGTSSEATIRDYRKTLEDYMSSRQIRAPSSGAVDFDDDISDDEGDVGGIDASEWIQQALHDSGETSLNQTKKKRTKKDHRDLHRQYQDQHHHGHTTGHGHNESHQKDVSSPYGHRKDDVMYADGKSTDGRSMDGNKSMDGMSLMSLAVSELEHIGRDNPHGGPADDSDMEEESVNFGSRANKMGAARSMASNQSVMSELTDFSDNDDDDVDGVDDL